MVEDLENGDVAETVKVFFEKSAVCEPQTKSVLTIQEVNHIANYHSYSLNKFNRFNCLVYCIVLYLYSVHYLHVLQDSKHYMTHPTAQVHPKSQVTDIPLNERQRLKDGHLSRSLRFLSLPLGIGPNDRGPPF